jgi:hypothetical protein
VDDVERENEAEDEEDADSPRGRMSDAVTVGVQEDGDRRTPGQRPGYEELGSCQLNPLSLLRGEPERCPVGPG